MATIGGDILEIRFTHPELGSGVLFAKANESNNKDLGGIRVNDDENQITGSGEVIWQFNQTRGAWEFVVAYDMNTREDLDKCAALSKHPKDADWIVSHSNGTMWGCTGRPVGTMQADTNAATFPLKIACPQWQKLN